MKLTIILITLISLSVVAFILNASSVEVVEATTEEVIVQDNIDKVLAHYEQALRKRNEARATLDEWIKTYEHAQEVFEQAQFNLNSITQ